MISMKTYYHRDTESTEKAVQFWVSVVDYLPAK